jgi:hypothetical protein
MRSAGVPGQQSLMGAVTEGFGGGQLMAASARAEAARAGALTPSAGRSP